MNASAMAMFFLGTVATVADLRSRRIPNWLTVAGICAGLALGARSAGFGGVAGAAVGALAGFSVFLLLHALGGMGGGDIKLMAAFGSLLGPGGAFLAALFAAVAGALLTAAVIACKPGARAIPYAPAIVAGAWLVGIGRS